MENICNYRIRTTNQCHALSNSTHAYRRDVPCIGDEKKIAIAVMAIHKSFKEND